VQKQFLNIPIEGAAEYSQATAELIDSEVREIISEQYAKALEILQHKRKVLDKGAELLLEKEKIEATELKSLMDEISAQPAKRRNKGA
jgi:cell division protease FtsH